MALGSERNTRQKQQPYNACSCLGSLTSSWRSRRQRREPAIIDRNKYRRWASWRPSLATGKWWIVDGLPTFATRTWQRQRLRVLQVILIACRMLCSIYGKPMPMILYFGYRSSSRNTGLRSKPMRPQAIRRNRSYFSNVGRNLTSVSTYVRNVSPERSFVIASKNLR